MTRSEARYAFTQSGAADRPISLERMCALRDAINKEMLASGLMDGTLHMKHSSAIKTHGDSAADLRCEAHYFEDREAVTINPDGFVGFAGWADDTHVQPILRGFMNWLHAENQA